jgi:hypothetical protein
MIITMKGLRNSSDVTDHFRRLVAEVFRDILSTEEMPFVFVFLSKLILV